MMVVTGKTYKKNIEIHKLAVKWLINQLFMIFWCSTRGGE